MSVEVIIPWRGGDTHREAALEWVLKRYAQRHPKWSVRLASLEEGPWIKALAVMPAIEDSEAAVVIVADADVWTEGLRKAAEALRSGAPWAIPHKQVYRLTLGATERCLAGGEVSTDDVVQRPYATTRGGGIVVARPQTLREVPLDSRFVGWGNEDRSWGRALTVLKGRPWQGKAPLIHLWHPPQERASRRWGSTADKRLYRTYYDAREDPDRMEEVVSAARAANQQALHASPEVPA